MKIKLLLFFLAIPFLSGAQEHNFIHYNVKIYSYKNSKLFGDKNYWLFYKIDWNNKVIQYVDFEFKDEDETPDLRNVRNLFKNIDKEIFVVLSSKKIKVKRIPRTKRAWNDFATPRKRDAVPATIYFIDGDTLRTKNKRVKLNLDKDLTIRYQQEKH
jgi:hypothetical protein